MSASPATCLDPAHDRTVFVTFTCRKDVHYAKALLGSIAHFYPSHAIHVVCESDVPAADFRQIQSFPNVVIHRVPDLIDRHKLNLTRLLAKFNVLFLPGVERALVADADSVLIDRVLDRIPRQSVFTGLAARPLDFDTDEGRQTFSTWCIDLEAMPRLGWSFKSSDRYYVGGSHFYIDVSQFPRQLLFDMLPLMGYRHDTRTPLRAGDQGFWSYVVNCWQGVLPDRVSALALSPGAVASAAARFPQASDPQWIAAPVDKGASFIHYIGFSRRLLRRHHVFAEALCWATDEYYRRVPGPRMFVADEARRIARTLSTAVWGRLARSGGRA